MDTNDIFDDLDSIFGDATDSDDMDALFGGAPEEKAEEKPAEVANNKMLDAKPEVEPELVDEEAEAEAMAEEPVEEATAEEVTEEPEQESESDITVEAENKPESEPKVEVEVAEETEVESEPETEVEVEPEVEIETKPNKQEVVEENDSEVEVEEAEEKPKKRKTRRAKKATAPKAEVATNNDGKTILNDDEPMSIDFVNHLLLTPGDEFDKQMEKATEMMNGITITADMSDAVIRTMEAKNTELAHYAETKNWAWHTAYENLTNRDTGLIKRVKDDAILHAEGTAKDKEIAATLAASNYDYNGKNINLLQYANALRGASYFFSRVLEFTKATGIALATCRKSL